MTITVQKKCKICNIEKPENDFTSRRSDAPCKRCRKNKQKASTLKRHRKLRENNLCIVCGKSEIKTRDMCSICIVRDRNRRREIGRQAKIDAVIYKGEKCEDCGIKSTHYEIYDFHHLDPEVKDDKLSNMFGRIRNFELIKIELDKCTLLCANCHRIRHGGGYE